MLARVRSEAWVLLAAGAVFFTNLGGPRLWDEDEPKNAACATEMLARGDWVTPQFNHQLRTDKPVMLYWLMMAAYSTLGATEWTARLPSALLGVGTVLLTWAMGRRLYSPRAGVWAGVALASCLMFDVAARAATPDSTLIFFATLSLALFVFAGGTQRDRLPWWAFVGMYAAMGLAVLAKGPVGVVLPTSVLVLFELCRRQQLGHWPGNEQTPPADNTTPASHAGGGWWGLLRRATTTIVATCSPSRVAWAAWRLRPLTALAVVAVVALPWYVWVGLRTDGAWLEGFLGKHNVGRFVSAMENHRGPIFYYIIAVMAGYFPWSVWLPGAVQQAVSRTRRADVWRSSDTFVLSWAGMYIGFFSLASTKLPSYVLPAYPALALLTGALLVRWLAQPDLLPRRATRLAIGSAAVVALGLAIGLPTAMALLLPHETVGGLALVFITVLTAAVGFAVAGWFHHWGQLSRALTTFAVVAVLFTTGLFGVAATQISTHHASPALAAAVELESAGAESDNAAIYSYRHFEPSLVFYTQRQVIELSSPELLKQWWTAERRPRLITRAEHLPEIAATLPVDWQVVERRPRFLRRGEVLVIEPVPQAAARPAAEVAR